MTKSDVVFAQATLEALKKENQDLKELRRFFSGTAKPGERPDLIARAIRQSIPLPLKYTQSNDSLKALFDYCMKTQDTKLYLWVCNQMRIVFGDALLKAFQDGRPRGTFLPTPTETARTQFIKKLKTMDYDAINTFRYRADIPEFYQKQMQRYIEMNDIRAQIRNEDPTKVPHKPLAETLRVSFFNEANLKRTSRTHPHSLIQNAKINPIVYTSCLIEAHAPRMNWSAVLQNEFFTKRKMLVKKLSIPTEIATAKLKSLSAPENVIDEVEKIGY